MAVNPEKARKRRIAIGGSTEPANDSLYTVLLNDTGATVKWAKAIEQIDVLGSDNLIAIPGAKSMTITGSISKVLDDEAFDDMEAAFHADTILYVQVRKDVAGVTKKETTVPCYVSTFEAAGGLSGVAVYNYELQPAGAAVNHSPPASLTTGA